MNGAGMLPHPKHQHRGQGSLTMSKAGFFRNRSGGGGGAGGAGHSSKSSQSHSHNPQSPSLSLSHAPQSPAYSHSNSNSFSNAYSNSYPSPYGNSHSHSQSQSRSQPQPQYQRLYTQSPAPSPALSSPYANPAKPSFAERMRGYTAGGAANARNASPAPTSPIRTGGLGGGGTGGHAHNTNNLNTHSSPFTPTTAGATTSTSWGLGGSSSDSISSPHAAGASPAGPGRHQQQASTSTSTWNRAAQIAQQAHRPQQTSADFDNMVASMGFNRFGMSPSSDRGHDYDSSAGGTLSATHKRGPSRGTGDIYLRMDSPSHASEHAEHGDMGDAASFRSDLNLIGNGNGNGNSNGNGNGIGSRHDGHEVEFDSDSEFARAFSPPRYAGYATLPEDDTPLSAVTATSTHDDRFTPLPTMRTRQQKSTSRQVDPRIGERALQSPPPHERHAPQSTSHSHAGAPTEESHESALSGSSAMTGVTSMTDSSAHRPQLSSSTSTAMTTVTTITSPTMGSDEMLMALMASQAAVDCDRMPVGGWEEVESWKKELQLLSTRLDALQARHQREVRILTAARTLQKLNQTNKRLSRQTTESLEESEKRVEKAEKEVLVLKSREASLRRRLMEHWAGVMAWEVRRLERTHSETQSRLEMHVRAAENDRESLIERLAAMSTGEHVSPKMVDSGELMTLQTRERELQARVSELEDKLHAERVAKADLQSERELTTSRLKNSESEREKRAGRIAELEEVVLELGRRERALEDGARGHDAKLGQLEREREDWLREREAFVREREGWERERSEWDNERAAHAQERDAWATQHEQMGRDVSDRDAWAAERQMLVAERDALQAERSALEAKAREHGAKSLAWVAERERLTADREMLHQDREATTARHEEERAAWASEREQILAERERLEAATKEHTGSKETWQRERETLVAKHERMAADLEALAVEHDRLKEESRSMQAATAERDQLASELEAVKDEKARLQVAADRATSSARSMTERLGGIVAAILGRRTVTETELVPALEEVRTLFDTQHAELKAIGTRHQEELRELSADRDTWKAKAEEAGQSTRAQQTEMTELVRKIRTQNEQISDMNAQLAATRSNPTGPSGQGARILETKLQRLWSALPSPQARAEAGMSDPRVVSPNAVVNFAMLQRAYAGCTDKYTNVDDLISRVQGLIDDGRLMVERMQRVEVEKDRHKMNATRAAQLVQDSRASLEKYQQQVQLLEERVEQSERDRLSGASIDNERIQEQLAELEREVSILQRELEQAQSENSRLRETVDENRATIDMFSARTLTMADDHEREKENLKAQIKAATDKMDEERARAQMQSAQIMGEMMDLQDEIAKLRSSRKGK